MKPSGGSRTSLIILLRIVLIRQFKQFEGIYEKAQLLRQFPEMGYRYDRTPNKHIRVLLYGHYRIAYLVKTDEDIDILGVFHGALDIDRYLY